MKGSDGFSEAQSKVQAVIVEPRQHDGLKLVLENMCEKLPEVPITLIHGDQNGEFAKEQAQNVKCVKHIYEANATNLDAASYSKLMTSNAFWDSMGDRPKTLVFQPDSGICGAGAELMNFVDYDYCGAPWKMYEEIPDRPLVGNGGFSLRDTSIFRKHVRESPEQTLNEDMVFVEWCRNDPDCTLCPDAVGRRFAVETMEDDDAWAFHNNLSYHDQPIQDCPLNTTVHDINKRTTGLGTPPSVDSWKPRISPSLWS
jgi:hypothetical protein